MDILFVAWYIGLALTPILLLVLYVQRNDSRLTQTPPRLQAFSPKRRTPQDVHAEAKRLASASPIDDTEKLPPKTGRRYIVIGGVGLFYTMNKRTVCLVFFFFLTGRLFGRVDRH